ncbi:MAG: magnesium/cobalt transporter CorA [Deltaproteobacteria bacterium]|nr:magnesium/cobalt transporter CorA [Deltaproteobacteria bacterium]
MLTAFLYTKQTGIQEIKDPSELKKTLSNKEAVLWVDLEDPNEDECGVLWEVFEFHPLAVEDCIAARIQYPKVEDYGDYLFAVFHGVHLGDGGKGLQTHEVDTFLGANYLVTFHFAPSRSVRSVREKCRKGEKIMDRGADYLLHEILDSLAENYTPTIEKLSDRLEQVEDQIFDNPDKKTLSQIFDLEKEILAVRRILHPEREVLTHLIRGEFRQIDRNNVPFFRDVYDRLNRMGQFLDTYRDLITGALSAYNSIVSNRLNEVMKVLTIFSTIILPLTLVSGIYGMNFKFMPELSWRYGYFFSLGLMTLIVAGLLIYFKRKKWF